MFMNEIVDFISDCSLLEYTNAIDFWVDFVFYIFAEFIY
jgi:hypothetical protein